MKFFSRRRLGADELQSLYRHHGPGLLLYACSMLGRKHAAEDVLQHVFMKLLEQNSIPEDPKPYLFRAVHNAALNQIRSESKHVELAELDLAAEPWFEAPHGDLAAQISLKAGLLELPDEQRRVLVLHVWGGLSFEETGSVLAVSANTTASRYRYALQKLRTLMQPKDSL